MGAGSASLGRGIIGLVLVVASVFWQLGTGGEVKGQIPELFDINLAVMMGTVGVILILWGAIETFYTTPLRKIIDDRNEAIEGTFTEVENLRSEMTQLKSDYERQLAETEAQAREKIQEQIKEATDLKKQLMADAQRQAEDYKRQAMDEIEAEKNKILTDLRVHVATLSIQATEKLLNANIDQERNKQLVDEFLATVEVKN